MAKEISDCFRQLGPSGRTLTPSAQVGISSLPDQFVNIELSKGASGIGKTSLLRTLFRINIPDEPHPNRSNEVILNEQDFDLNEAGVNLHIRLIESRGFGDQIDKSDSSKKILQYINDQFDGYFSKESKVDRDLGRVKDMMVHACIYMISPSGSSLTALDLMTLKELQTKVNVILVIGKSDTLTKPELKAFKSKILSDLLEKGIEVYKCPTDDPTLSTKNSELNSHIPFGIIASSDEEVVNNQLCRIRKYPWGTVVVDDESHCEFTQFREMVLRNNLFNLIQTTHSKFYWRYRNERVKASPGEDSVIARSMEKVCSDFKKSNDEELLNLKTEYDVNSAALYEKFKNNEIMLRDKYTKRINELESQRQQKLEVVLQRRHSSKGKLKTEKSIKAKK